MNPQRSLSSSTSPPVGPRNSESRVGPRNSESRAVLVIDDDTSFREALRDVLEERGLTVVVACDAYDAERELEGCRFDAVFSDIRMPGGGFLVLEQVRRLQPQTPVILVTGSGSDDWRERAGKEGAFAYLPKPVGKDQILEVLQRALARARLRSAPRDRPVATAP